MAGKSRQAELLADFCRTTKPKDYVFHRLTEKEHEERAGYFAKMRSFQEKGLAPTTTKRTGR
jgi:hypothetical protein